MGKFRYQPPITMVGIFLPKTWHKSFETLLYNYDMRKGSCHVQNTEKL